MAHFECQWRVPVRLLRGETARSQVRAKVLSQFRAARSGLARKADGRGMSSPLHFGPCRRCASATASGCDARTCSKRRRLAKRGWRCGKSATKRRVALRQTEKR